VVPVIVVADLATVRQPEQLIARLSSTVKSLPLPDFVPPAKVRAARRLDRAAEIRRLAKGWQNCLESYLWRIDGGECAVYLWEDADTKAAVISGLRPLRMATPV
jgi:hypothetical protein